MVRPVRPSASICEIGPATLIEAEVLRSVPLTISILALVPAAKLPVTVAGPARPPAEKVSVCAPAERPSVLRAARRRSGGAAADGRDRQSGDALAEAVEAIAVDVVVVDAEDHDRRDVEAVREMLGDHQRADARQGIGDDADPDLAKIAVHEGVAMTRRVLHAVGAAAPVDHEGGMGLELGGREGEDVLRRRLAGWCNRR